MPGIAFGGSAAAVPGNVRASAQAAATAVRVRVRYAIAVLPRVWAGSVLRLAAGRPGSQPCFGECARAGQG
ncbi:hypothetical protein Amsp01_028330 [Amycolatopsis sp. NBRC 101858]|nr:hypothetical protein Amsp01_028330 [Amycolatopsis sp. NBRC 101858]